MPDDSAFCHRCGARIAVEQSRGDEPSAGEHADRLPPPVGLRTSAAALPGWVCAQLLPGEAVLARTSGGHADHFATDRRLLRFRRKSNCEAVPYSHLSVSLQKYGWGWQIFRLFTVVFSFAVVALGVLVLWGPTVDDTDYGGPTPIAIFFFVAGGLTLLAVLVYRYRYYQISVWRADRGSSERRCIERPRVAIGNAALDRFAAVLEKGSRASGSPEAEKRPRPRPRLWADQPGLKWSRALGASAPVIGLMWLLGTQSGGDLYQRTHGGYGVGEEALLLGFVLLPLAAGFIAGVWTNWRGTTHGALAGLCVAGGAWAYGITRLIVERPATGEFTAFGFGVVFLGPVLAIVCSAAAGFLGERVRG